MTEPGQTQSCQSCGSVSVKKLFTRQGRDVVRCRQCSFVYVNVAVSAEHIHSLYARNYFRNSDYGYENYESEKYLRKKNFRRWLNDAIRFLPPDKKIHALDVGCAAGYCMDIMEENGWTAKGLELEKEMFTRLTEGGYDTENKTLEEFISSSGFSIITLFDVIEHMPCIDLAFKKLFDLLSDKGIIVMVTPDHSSWQRQLSGKKWFQYKPIEHLYYFTRETLTVFASRNGLTPVFYSGCGQYADSSFLVNRLRHYKQNRTAACLSVISRIMGLKNRFFYAGTGSLYIVFRKA